MIAYFAEIIMWLRRQLERCEGTTEYDLIQKLIERAAKECEYAERMGQS